MIKHQAKGEFPNPEDESENLEDVPPLDAEREAIDVPGEDLHNTDEADASDDPYNLGARTPRTVRTGGMVPQLRSGRPAVVAGCGANLRQGLRIHPHAERGGPDLDGQ